MKHWIKLVCIALALLLCGCTAQQAPDEPGQSVAQTTEMTQPAQGVAQTTEPAFTQPTLPPVEITMPDYTFSYSGALADVISLQEHTDGSGILFTVQLSEQTAPVFDMFYNSQDGELVTVLVDGDGNRVPVAFHMMDAPLNLGQEDEFTFYSVQDAVNEIVASLRLQ